MSQEKTPEQKIAELEKVLTRLRLERVDMERTYQASEVDNALGFIDKEINRTIVQIAIAKIDIAKRAVKNTV